MLQATDILTRVGFSVIDGANAVRYTCQIPLDKPEGMTIGRTVLKPDLYKEHRDECRADYATFEDESYEQQQRLIDKLSE